MKYKEEIGVNKVSVTDFEAYRFLLDGHFDYRKTKGLVFFLIAQSLLEN